MKYIYSELYPRIDEVADFIEDINTNIMNLAEFGGIYMFGNGSSYWRKEEFSGNYYIKELTTPFYGCTYKCKKFEKLMKKTCEGYALTDKEQDFVVSYYKHIHEVFSDLMERFKAKRHFFEDTLGLELRRQKLIRKMRMETVSDQRSNFEVMPNPYNLYNRYNSLCCFTPRRADTVEEDEKVRIIVKEQFNMLSKVGKLGGDWDLAVYRNMLRLNLEVTRLEVDVKLAIQEAGNPCIALKPDKANTAEVYLSDLLPDIKEQDEKPITIRNLDARNAEPYTYKDEKVLLFPIADIWENIQEAVLEAYPEARFRKE